MRAKKYDSLVAELTSFIIKCSELEDIKSAGEFDLKWRLTQLYEDVAEEDEQKFIEISGMQGHLMTSSQKRELAKIEKQKVHRDTDSYQKLSEITQVQKNTTDKAWAKSLYRRAVKRCHPDTIKVKDDNYRQELTDLYKNITESYENNNLDILMVETYKLLVKPKEVIREQIDILEKSKNLYHDKIEQILKSQGYAWSKFNDTMKEVFLINLLKQKGVRFVDKKKVRQIVKRKISSRKMGQKPQNKMRSRVKNKK